MVFQQGSKEEGKPHSTIEEVDILRTSQEWRKLLVGNQLEDGWLKKTDVMRQVYCGSNTGSLYLPSSS